MQRDIEATNTLSALAYCRRMVLQRASSLLDAPADTRVPDRSDALSSVSALLMTSLEELKVAEEELREQGDRLVAQQKAMDEAIRQHRQIFQLAPLPVVLTDRYGTIHDVNVAATELFRRDAHYMHRKPLAAFVTVPSRDKFRTQLARMTEERPLEWRIELRRNGDVSVEVCATVGFLPDIGPNCSGLLCWMVHPRPADDQ